MPLDGNASEPEPVESAGGNFSAHGVDRDERDAQPGHHPLLDRLGVVKLHRDPELHARLLQHALRDAAGCRSFFTHEQRVFGERVGPNIPAPRPCVPGRDDENELIAHSRRETFLTGPEGMTADDS